MVAAALVLEPSGIDPSHLSQAALPTSQVLGRLGLAFALVGFFWQAAHSRWA
jgi:manganese transport protein